MEISFSTSSMTCFTVTDSGSSQLKHHKQNLMETNWTIKLILKACLLHLQQLVSFWRKNTQFASKPPQTALSVPKLDYLEPWPGWYNLIFTHGLTVLLRVIWNAPFLFANHKQPRASANALESSKFSNGLDWWVNKSVAGMWWQKPLGTKGKMTFVRDLINVSASSPANWAGKHLLWDSPAWKQESQAR